MDVTSASDADVRRSMDRFEAAVTAEEPVLTPPSVRRILLAIDGSNQDPTAAALAAHVAGRLGAELLVTWAYPGPADAAREATVAAVATRLGKAARLGDAVPLALDRADAGRRSFDHIVHAVRDHGAGLLVVNAPYDDDFAELGAVSVGTNLDVLMARLDVPILAVRAPRTEDEVARAFRRIVVPVGPADHAPVEAVAWALRLVAAGGELVLGTVVDVEALGGPDALPANLDEIDVGTLAGLGRPRVAGLIAAAQRGASVAEVACRVHVRPGRFADEIMALAGEAPALLVGACPRDPARGRFQRMQALVRTSGHPVLVV